MSVHTDLTAAADTTAIAVVRITFLFTNERFPAAAKDMSIVAESSIDGHFASFVCAIDKVVDVEVVFLISSSG
jgi:hypothetical protein